MSSDKLENIYKLLTENNFNTNQNVPDKLKCGKCRKILIKACQTRCGCRFCGICVDEMRNNGCQFCPGITEDCKNELLSTVQMDYRVCNKISKLIMKCPEMCSFKCELSKMSEHLRICREKHKECPFYKFGCDMKNITNENLIEHFQLENYNHNKTLIDIIDNMKTENEELREKEIKNHEEFNKLKLELQSKNEKLESLNLEIHTIKEKLQMGKHVENLEEILNNEISKLNFKYEKEMQSIKSKNEEYNDQTDIRLRNLWIKIDKMDLELKEIKENDKNESIKTERKNILKENENFKNKINTVFNKNLDKIKSTNDEIRLEMQERKCIIDKSIVSMRNEPRINHVSIKMNGVFEWFIDKIDRLRINDEHFKSEYFCTQTKPYKLRLGIFHSYGNKLQIRLYICDDLSNQKLEFPFSADVTMKIINKNKPEVFVSNTVYCQIEKLTNNALNYCDNFFYSCSDLIERGILESNCFIVQCCVELK